MTPAESILNAALALPPEERAILADKLLDSLDDKQRDEIDAAWVVEIERRSKDLDAGREKLISGEEVMRSLRSRSNQRGT